MKPELKTRIGRRALLAALLAVPAVALVFRVIRPTAHEDLVEVDGWILKRSDIDGGRA